MNEIRKEMRLLFLIFVIAWFHPSVYSAPFDVRIGRGLALRLHRRQVAYQGEQLSWVVFESKRDIRLVNYHLSSFVNRSKPVVLMFISRNYFSYYFS